MEGTPWGLPSIGGHHGHVRLGLGWGVSLLAASALQRGPSPDPGSAWGPASRPWKAATAWVCRSGLFKIKFLCRPEAFHSNSNLS